MNDKPMVDAQITFLTPAEGGRVRLPDLSAGSYMPHVVVQSPHIRQATVILDTNIISEDYLGVRFVNGPKDYTVGESGLFVLELMHFPQMKYESLKSGSTFTLREGGKIVGFGEVKQRREPPSAM